MSLAKRLLATQFSTGRSVRFRKVFQAGTDFCVAPLREAPVAAKPGLNFRNFQ